VSNHHALSAFARLTKKKLDGMRINAWRIDLQAITTGVLAGTPPDPGGQFGSKSGISSGHGAQLEVVLFG
jgi:hypothetical protein